MEKKQPAKWVSIGMMGLLLVSLVLVVMETSLRVKGAAGVGLGLVNMYFNQPAFYRKRQVNQGKSSGLRVYRGVSYAISLLLILTGIWVMLP